MSNIPTATGLIRKKFPIHDGVFVLRTIEEFMIEFAKFHVQAALEAASKISLNYEIDEKAFDKMGEEIPSLRAEKQNKKSIINAYPLTNII
jgi:hypothetical protein